MTVFTINPATIHDLSNEGNLVLPLDAFFKSQKQLNKHVWLPNQTYKYISNNIEYEFQFTESIIRRGRKRNKIGDRFDIYGSQLIGQGKYGSVFPIIGSIKFESKTPQFKPALDKIVKIQAYSDKTHKDRVIKEYASLNQANHLNVVPPIFQEDEEQGTGYLIMNKADGYPLEMILHPKKRSLITVQLPHLTVLKRLELTLAILNAIKSQVTDKNIVHRDLKPYNLMIDFNTSPPIVTVIDYGFALINGNQDHAKLGTNAYRSPESYKKLPIYSAQSDVYSVGRILSYLWGDNHHNYYFDPKTDFNIIRERSYNESLFKEPELKLFQYDKNKIRSYLQQMMHSEPNQRPRLDQVIEQFSSIKKEKYYINKIQDASNTEFKRYEAHLKNQFDTILNKINRLEQKKEDLVRRNCIQAADAMSQLHEKLQMNTIFRAINPDPLLIMEYQELCFKTINEYKPLLHEHRDVWWLVAEISAAIGLLGIGYLFAAGINYYKTGRLGLFSQTKSDKILDDVYQSIAEISI